MRLIELNPRWFAEPGRREQGFTFDCPHCRGVRLSVLLAAPLDGGPLLPHANEPGNRRYYEALWNDLDRTIGVTIVPVKFHWSHRGDSFENLTLTPSVDHSPSGHWHGFLTAGECC